MNESTAPEVAAAVEAESARQTALYAPLVAWMAANTDHAPYTPSVGVTRADRRAFLAGICLDPDSELATLIPDATAGLDCEGRKPDANLAEAGPAPAMTDTSTDLGVALRALLLEASVAAPMSFQLDDYVRALLADDSPLADLIRARRTVDAVLGHIAGRAVIVDPNDTDAHTIIAALHAPARRPAIKPTRYGA